jgi:hypothetical protein
MMTPQFSFPQPLIVQALVWQGSDAVLLARCRSVNGVYVTQSSLSSITLQVWDKNLQTLVYGPINLVVSNVIFNTLQTNPVLWTQDVIGYNFLYQLNGVLAFPNADDYKVNVLLYDLNMPPRPTPLQYQCSAERVP